MPVVIKISPFFMSCPFSFPGLTEHRFVCTK
nr:MAG TPA: hypothetical protein [Caudoviricetes sp.]